MVARREMGEKGEGKTIFWFLPPFKGTSRLLLHTEAYFSDLYIVLHTFSVTHLPLKLQTALLGTTYPKNNWSNYFHYSVINTVPSTEGNEATQWKSIVVKEDKSTRFGEGGGLGLAAVWPYVPEYIKEVKPSDFYLLGLKLYSLDKCIVLHWTTEKEKSQTCECPVIAMAWDTKIYYTFSLLEQNL